MRSHLDPEALVRWVDAERAGSAIDEADRAHVETEVCTVCRSRLETTRAVVLSFAADPLAPVPAEWVERALARLREETVPNAAQAAKAGLSERIRDAVRELSATLVLDTRAGALLPGVRGAATAGVRQLLFESREAQVHLRIEESDDGRWILHGQVVPLAAARDLGSGRATLRPSTPPKVRRGRQQTSVPLSNRGEFSLPGSGSGRIALRIEWDGIALDLDPFDVPPAETSLP